MFPLNERLYIWRVLSHKPFNTGIQGNKQRDEAATLSQWSHCACRSCVTNVCMREWERESHAVRKDCTTGTVPNSCQGCTLVSVTSICFTSLLINWNAAPEIELGTSINCSIVPAGQCSENSTRHSRHFPIFPFYRVSGEDIKHILHYWPASL